MSIEPFDQINRTLKQLKAKPPRVRRPHSKLKRMIAGICPRCPDGGDVYIDYKNGSCWRCAKCSGYFEPRVLTKAEIQRIRRF